MSRRLLLLVAALLTAAAICVWLSPLVTELRVAAVQALLAVLIAFLVADVLVRRRVSRLVDAANSLAGGTMISIAEHDPVFGPLSAALLAVGRTLEESQYAATTDKLTHLLNRPAVLSELLTEVDRARRHERPLSLAFVDLDHFKMVNDTYGHAVGDAVLQRVAAILRDNVRATDQVGRYGGEELLIVMPETTPEDATHVAEKLRLLVASAALADETGNEFSITVSIGIAGGIGDLTAEALIHDADMAMYTAKAMGRNCTFVFSERDQDAVVPRAPITPEGRQSAIEIGKAARDAAERALTLVVAPLPHYRGKPSSLIATTAVAIGRNLGLAEEELDRIRLASLLHDIGKVAIPDEILEKPSSLTPLEWRAVVQHPRIGQVILEEASGLREAAPIVLHHHERFGGHGYPHGLRGEQIPLGSRILAVADAYDAMVQDRPYQAAVSHDEAVRELRRCAGTQFDPDVVDAFCELFAGQPPVADIRVLLSRQERRRRRASA